MPSHRLLDLSREIADAMERGDPVVALESSYLAEGLPRPHNVETLRSAEAAVRARGALPATIAVLDGRIRIGLDAGEIARIDGAKKVLKLGGGDLAYALASKVDGVTTVSGTVAAATLAGIRLMATGGLGGVHRGVETSWDVSADLKEISNRPVCVVCAGAKSILDLPKTLEVLETQGVPVIGYRTDEFPAFWSRSSGLPLSQRFDTAQDVAGFLRIQAELGRSGCILTNPADPEMEIPLAELEPIIGAALADAQKAGIGGKAVTPYLLERIAEATGRRTITVNSALIVNNAALAAEVAVAYAGRRAGGSGR